MWKLIFPLSLVVFLWAKSGKIRNFLESLSPKTLLKTLPKLSNVLPEKLFRDIEQRAIAAEIKKIPGKFKTPSAEKFLARFPGLPEQKKNSIRVFLALDNKENMTFSIARILGRSEGDVKKWIEET